MEDQIIGQAELKYSLNLTIHGAQYVCDDNWDDQNAQVICRQLGLDTNGTSVLGFSPSASPSVLIWLNNVNCNGLESRLIDCQHNGIGNHNCDDRKDAGVLCEIRS